MSAVTPVSAFVAGSTVTLPVNFAKPPVRGSGLSPLWVPTNVIFELPAEIVAAPFSSGTASPKAAAENTSPLATTNIAQALRIVTSPHSCLKFANGSAQPAVQRNNLPLNAGVGGSSSTTA